MITCRDCHRTLPDEQFRFPTGKTYRRTECGDCERTASRNRNRARAEELRAYSRAYAREHREERNEYRRQRIARLGQPTLTPEQRARKLTLDNERRRAMPLEQRQARAAKWAGYFHDRYEARADEWRARFAIRRGATVAPIIDSAIIIERDHGRCYICGVEVPPGPNRTLDHVIPLSRGGEHSEANLRLACRSCNCRKRNKLLAEMAS